jgi:hypothetical protein
MTRAKGLALAAVGFGILVGSLVLSTPFAGRSEASRAARSPVVLPGAPAVLVPPPPSWVPAEAGEPGQPVQESGPIVYRGEEPDAYLDFPVPVGKRLIIDSVSVRANVGAGQRVNAGFTATHRGATAACAVPLVPQGNFPKQGEVFAGTADVQVRAEGGTVVRFRVERTAPGENDGGFVSLFGRLE